MDGFVHFEQQRRMHYPQYDEGSWRGELAEICLILVLMGILSFVAVLFISMIMTEVRSLHDDLDPQGWLNVTQNVTS